ncbi:MAG: hypothetical protein ACOYO0_00440 [Sandarakinorhabdus sp.]
MSFFATARSGREVVDQRGRQPLTSHPSAINAQVSISDRNQSGVQVKALGGWRCCHSHCKASPLHAGILALLCASSGRLAIEWLYVNGPDTPLFSA